MLTPSDIKIGSSFHQQPHGVQGPLQDYDDDDEQVNSTASSGGANANKNSQQLSLEISAEYEAAARSSEVSPPIGRASVVLDDDDHDETENAGRKTSVAQRTPGYSISLLEALSLVSFNFPYGFICGTMGLCILPEEASHLFPNNASWALGFFLGLVGLSQLICPVAGRLSDNCRGATTVYGRRAPFLLWSTFVALAGTLGMWFFSIMKAGFMYGLSLLLGMLALNVYYSVQCGLIPDLGDDAKQGTASGAVAVLTLLGSASGFGIMILCSKIDYHIVYPIYIVITAAVLFLTAAAAYVLENRCIAINAAAAAAAPQPAPPQTLENTSQDLHLGEEEPPRLTHISIKEFLVTHIKVSLADLLMGLSGKQLIQSFKLRADAGYTNFYWVFISRTLYYISVSVQAFIIYFLRDVVGTTSPSARQAQVGAIALVAQGFAALVALPIGRLTDSSGGIDDKREKIAVLNKKPMIYVACIAMSTVYLGFMASPWFGTGAFSWVLGTSVVYGAGNGCFLAVDYALALASLPDKSKAAQALGLWGLSAFLGSAIGPLLWGALVQIGGSAQNSTGETGYKYTGYLAILSGGILSTCGAAWAINRMKNIN